MPNKNLSCPLFDDMSDVIIDVWDLSLHKKITRWADNEILFEVPISDELIYPLDESSNERPYLQDYFNPKIDDLNLWEDNRVNEKIYFLDDILHSLESKDEEIRTREFRGIVKDFFQCLNDMFKSHEKRQGKDADVNVILVRDSLPQIGGEVLLQNCGLPRSKTYLLWYSIAITLGAEYLWKEKTWARDLLVVNQQQDWRRGAIIKLVEDKNSGFTVPKRSKYRDSNGKINETKYPLSLSGGLEYEYDGKTDSKREIHKKMYGMRAEDLWIPNRDGSWERKDFHNLRRKPVSLKFCECDLAILAGVTKHIDDSRVPCKIPEMGVDFPVWGCVNFWRRKRQGVPPYFDECEALSLVRIDRETETIVAEELLPANEQCIGGMEIIGKTNKNCVIEKGTSSVNFFLLMGNPTPNAKLKMLKQDLGVEATQVQQLTIIPRMIPGQGEALVTIEGAPLLEEPVTLDFMNMENSEETMASLEANLDRSFPADFPMVRASYDLWDQLWNEQDYLRDIARGLFSFVDGSWFAKARYVDKNRSGVERFERENVFGNHPDYRLPNNWSFPFDDLFNQLAKAYWNKDLPEEKHDKIIRLIAWSYQEDNPAFQKILRDVLKKMRDAALHGKNVTFVEFTLCGNYIIQDDDFQTYVNCFICRFEKAESGTPPFKGVMHWLRTLYYLLIFRSNTPKVVPTSDWNDVVDWLLKYIWQHIDSVKDTANPQMILHSIYCLLFVLKRRRYDKAFLKIGSTTYNEVEEVLHEIEEERGKYPLWTLTNPDTVIPLCECTLKFLNGKGKISDIELPASE